MIQATPTNFKWIYRPLYSLINSTNASAGIVVLAQQIIHGTVSEDSKILDGGWSNTSPAQPLKEDGYVQMFNDTASGVVKYNFTTSADRPVIRTRVNGNLFTFTADFADGSNYDEHGIVYSVICEVSESADGLIIKYATVVVPTMTVSLKRLSGPALTAAPTPEPTSSSCMTGSFFAMTALASASSAFLLL